MFLTLVSEIFLGPKKKNAVVVAIVPLADPGPAIVDMSPMGKKIAQKAGEA